MADGKKITPGQLKQPVEDCTAEKRDRNDRSGRSRDDTMRLRDRLVPRKDLPDGEGGVKKCRREPVRMFPEVLAKARLEVLSI